MAILSVLRSQHHHAKAKEPHFIFLHIPIIYKPFKTIYQALGKLNQELHHTASNAQEIFTTLHT